MNEKSATHVSIPRAGVSVLVALAMVVSMALPFGAVDQAYAAQSGGKVAVASTTKSLTGGKDANRKEQKAKVKLTAPKSINVKAGKTLRINVKATKGAAVTYKSSKKSVVTVSKSGIVKAKAAGKATITITAKKGGTFEKKTVKVTVAKPKAPAKPKVPTRAKKDEQPKAADNPKTSEQPKQSEQPKASDEPKQDDRPDASQADEQQANEQQAAGQTDATEPTEDPTAPEAPAIDDGEDVDDESADVEDAGDDPAADEEIAIVPVEDEEGYDEPVACEDADDEPATDEGIDEDVDEGIDGNSNDSQTTDDLEPYGSEAALEGTPSDPFVLEGIAADEAVVGPQRPKTYTVNFSANGGKGSMAVQTITSGVRTMLKSNAFTRSGYKFTGWNTRANGTGTAYANTASVSDLTIAGGSVTLYAQWSYIKHGVITENGVTYYYKADGTKAYGWVTEDGVTRYCNPRTGAMAKGGEVYISTSDGVSGATGYRYFEPDGAIFLGWKTINGKAKYFRPADGVRCTGEVFIPKGQCGTAVDGWRNFDANGSIILGWKTVGGVDKYYGPDDGVRYVGVREVFHPGGSNWYDFRSSDGARLADVAAGDFYFRAGDGVGLRYDSAEYARLVYNAYNQFRLTRSNAAGGRYAVAWSGDSNFGSNCGDAFEAKVSSQYCATQKKLVHTAYNRRADLRSKGVYMSDILAYASYMMTPTELINMWANSAGHRKMMQCDTAHHMGFAAVKSSNLYYYTIVYEWSNHNQSGS